MTESCGIFTRKSLVEEILKVLENSALLYVQLRVVAGH
jgi:hypothetical protein